ncbi:MAG: hypothetical protein ACKVOQ_05730 [Cyclobacteriaceae bacterium]
MCKFQIKVVCFFLLTTNFLESTGQGFVEGGISYNGFDMGDLKSLQKELFIGSPVQTHVTSAFPSYIGFHIAGGISFKKSKSTLKSGASIDYTSTGGRVSYSDYSGILRGDQLLNLWSIGIFGGVEYPINKNFSLGLVLPINFDLTSFELKNELIIGGVPDGVSYNFKSTGLSTLPKAEISYSISSISFGLYAGYQILLMSKPFLLTTDGQSTLVLANSSEPLRPNWNGFRSGFVIRYLF